MKTPPILYATAAECPALPEGWVFVTDNHFFGNRVTKKFITSGWTDTMMLVNKIGLVSSRKNHHPSEVKFTFNSVEIEIRTNDSDGVTNLDVAWVEAVEKGQTFEAGCTTGCAIKLDPEQL